jgi:hypothetical protein
MAIQLDSPFQLQEHLKALYHNYTRPTGSSTVAPITRKVAEQLAEPPEGVERSLWLYELCRFLTMKVNNLLIAFFAEEPPCSAQTCPEMRASEWQYLCAVHDPPKSCCAIDYCCHTLDWATNILTSPKYFPSRLTLGSDAGGGPQASMRHLTNIFRRLYRIFAHAWFQHRAVFWQVEGCDGLYVFFKAVCDVYQLIPPDNYTVPPDAEGDDAPKPAPAASKQEARPKMTILRKEDKSTSAVVDDKEADSTLLNAGATTRRHRYSASRGGSVTTITEAAEDDDEDSADKRGQDGEGTTSQTDPAGTSDSDALPTEAAIAESTGETAAADADKPPLDTELNSNPPSTEDEEESHESDDDIGSPAPDDPSPDFQVVIQPTATKEGEETTANSESSATGDEQTQETEPESAQETVGDPEIETEDSAAESDAETVTQDR